MVAAIFLLSYMPYWTRMTKVIRSAQLLDKDQAKLSHMIAAVPALVFISTCGILGGLLIVVQYRDIGLMGKFL